MVRRQYAGELIGNLDRFHIVAAGPLAGVHLPGPRDEGAGHRRDVFRRPCRARQGPDALGRRWHLITALDHGSEGGKNGHGFAARADGGANGVALRGGDNVIGALEVGDGPSKQRHHALVGGGAQLRVRNERETTDQALQRERGVGGFLPHVVERAVGERDGGPGKRTTLRRVIEPKLQQRGAVRFQIGRRLSEQQTPDAPDIDFGG